MPLISQSSKMEPIIANQASDGISDTFTLMDLVIISLHFGTSQPFVFLKISTVASLIKETSVITPTSLLKKDLTYTSNTF